MVLCFGDREEEVLGEVMVVDRELLSLTRLNSTHISRYYMILPKLSSV